MSSAMNHAKRSHRSHALHYRAAGIRKIETIHRQERRGVNPLLRAGFFKHRRITPPAAKGGSPLKEGA